jgi:multidrug efflux system outer membrane protein
MRRALGCLMTALVLSGCLVGPDYRRPEIAVPSTFRGATPEAAQDARSFGDLEWWKVFQDEQLQNLVRIALEQNYDLRVAVARILQARSQVVIARSFQFPTADLAVAAPYDRQTGGNKTPNYETFLPQGGASVAWELDLWGRFRRATEAARADLLATEDFRRTVVLTLISDVARAYFTLRELDLEMEISTRTLATRADFLRLTKAREQGGVATLLDVRQAEQLYFTAAATIADLDRSTEQQENLISILVGNYPEAIPRGRPLTQQTLALPPVVPPGLTSALLGRRPDILQAEQQLVSANARIGEAKALLFPSVVISGFAGVGGAVINGSSFGPFGAFNALPTITLPFFNMGRLSANVDFNDARTQEALLRYQQSIQQAYGEVADALVGVRKRKEVREQNEASVAAQRDALRLSTMRYEGGVASFLEVLVTERDLFDLELVLAQSWRDEILAVVQLYKVLGGGWQTETPPLASTAASEPRPANVGPSASEGGTVPAGDPAGVHAGSLSVAEEKTANGADAESGGLAAGGGDHTIWGSVKTFFGSLFSKW